MLDGCSWSLKSPRGVVQCLYYLRSLRVHIIEELQQVLDTEVPERTVNSYRKPWRSLASEGGSGRRPAKKPSLERKQAEDEEQLAKGP